MTVVSIMLGGPSEHLPKYLASEQHRSLWIGVDRGALRLLENGIVPTMALGDFDSVSYEEFQKIEEAVPTIIKVKAEKDDTDTELAIQEAFDTLKAEKVVLYGGTGGRIDHLFSVLLLPAQTRFSAYVEKIAIKDKQNTVTYYLPGEYEMIKEDDKTYVSFVALTPVRSLTLRGLKYPLTDHDVPHPMAYVSNEFQEKVAQASFKEGLLAVIQSKD
ncbi:thiamine diphosphokinase [Atopococcus tabaci]|uniref:thiamine diphosphokinase n=1 Tax=Atopococcus tabaci TaxID=269774 RepID=UPI0003F88A86|nr:thiamine diphosphokinase [Atopococcus tabaci]